MGKRWGCWLLAAMLLLMTAMVPAEAEPADNGGTVVGYYASWAAAQGWPPDKLQTEGLTQINYAFAVIADGKASLTAADRTNLQALVRLNGPEIVLSIGGWDGSGGFSDAAASSASRERFAQSCLDLILELGLNGVDLDWEYPVSGGAVGITHRPQDRQNFTLLLQAIRQKLDQQSRRDGKTYRLTIAGGAGTGYLSCIEPQAVAALVDHVFLMTYDFHGPWDSRSGFNAPLTGVDAAVTAWTSRGVPPEKLVLGIPLYGYIFQGASGPDASYTSAKSVSYDTLKRDYLPSFRQLQDAAESVPYLVGNNAFVTYEDPASAAAKGALAQSRGLGGIGFWELSQDRNGELVQAAAGAWQGSGFWDVPASAWYASAVASVAEDGLMLGTAAGRFDPERTVTRGQIAAILHRTAGSPAASGTPFSDVAPSSYCAQAAAWAANVGVIQGYDGGLFQPDLPVTRQQLAAILFRYASLQGRDSGQRSSLQPFPDGNSVSPYAQEALRWAISTGILQGRADGRLDPGGSATRAQTAVLLCRFLEL